MINVLKSKKLEKAVLGFWIAIANSIICPMDIVILTQGIIGAIFAPILLP